MKVKHNLSQIQLPAIVLLAILLGVFAAPILLPRTILEHPIPAVSFYSFRLAVSGGLLAVVVFRFAYIKWIEDRHHQYDQLLLDAFLEHIPENVYFKDRESRFVRVSSSLARNWGFTDPTQTIDRSDADGFSNEHAEQALADEQEIMRTGRSIIEKEEKETWPDGRETWVLTTKVPLRDQYGKIVGTMGISHSITDRKQTEMRIRQMALHDALTGLPNRILLEDRLHQAIAASRRSQTRVLVMMLDLDRFKNINDSLGHYAGDRLLEAVATRLRGCIRESDTVARLGGDEFVLVITGVAQQKNPEPIAEKALHALSQPFQIEGNELQIAASLGVAVFPDNGKNPELLLQYADTAMYAAKKSGRGQYCFFSAELTEAAQREQEFETELVQACKRHEFVLHYQPFIDSKSGVITGTEALIRWQHPTRGLVPPNQFIPQLEDLGLMEEVGHWVLLTACRQAVEWQTKGLPPIRMAVNVSSQQFFRGDFAATVDSILREAELDPSLLELELTESRLFDDSEATMNVMRRLKRIGVTLSLDDFGTGWSSLSYLRQFPIDRIKIDRAFIRDLATQPTAKATVRCILGLARNLDIPCIAEGVETAEQRQLLLVQHCPEMQGYYFSRPLNEEQATPFLVSAMSKSRITVNASPFADDSGQPYFDRSSSMNDPGLQEATSDHRVPPYSELKM